MPNTSLPKLSGLLFGTLASTLAAGTAWSAAIERAVPATSRILFEEGRYVEFGITYSDPDQRGDDANLTALGQPFVFEGSTGDLFEDYFAFSGAYKADINDKFSYALYFDQPFGADTKYPSGPMAGPGGAQFDYNGTAADLKTHQISGVLAYDVNGNVKVYGGLRAQRLVADASIPFVGPSQGLPGYTVETDADWGFGYLAGAAYYIPEIALRVSLTYYSSIDHKLDTTEFDGLAIPGAPSSSSTTEIETPQSATLDLQTGVAENTLIFGSIRWVDWSDFSIEPAIYSSAAGTGNPLVDYTDDWWTYTAGVAQRFNEKLAGSLSVTYEPDVDAQLTTLGPYDGRTTVAAALSYDVNPKLNISGGLTYGKIGDTSNILQTDFNDGSVWGAGIRVGYSF